MTLGLPFVKPSEIRPYSAEFSVATHGTPGVASFWQRWENRCSPTSQRRSSSSQVARHHHQTALMNFGVASADAAARAERWLHLPSISPAAKPAKLPQADRFSEVVNCLSYEKGD